jgi:hypothetical protein
LKEGVGCGVWGVGRINKNNLLPTAENGQLYLAVQKNYYFSTKSHNLSLFLTIILSKARNFLATAVNRPLFKLFKGKLELISIKFAVNRL